MVRGLSLVAAAALVAVAGPAGAGTFGGFSKDRATYLDGDDQVCKPLRGAAPKAGPACEEAAPAAIAAAGYRVGVRQSSTTGLRAEARGSTLRVLKPGVDKPVVEWDAGGVVSRVVAVYATDDGAVVAVEYATRRFGRATTESVAFRLAGTPGKAPAPDSTPTPTPTPAHDPQELAEARAQAMTLYKRRKWKKAATAAKAYLDMDAEAVEVRYAYAVSLARTGNTDAALAELERIGASSAKNRIVWLVEARTDKAFRKLRKQPRFRAAVGLDKKPGAVRHAYERVLEGKGVWEQEMIRCDQARVTLELERQPRKFSIKIVSSCQGYTDRLRLGGTWDAEGTSVLLLTFPNEGGSEERTRCEIRTCADDSGEDCIHCALDSDLAMTLRPVRR